MRERGGIYESYASSLGSKYTWEFERSLNIPNRRLFYEFIWRYGPLPISYHYERTVIHALYSETADTAFLPEPVVHKPSSSKIGVVNFHKQGMHLNSTGGANKPDSDYSTICHRVASWRKHDLSRN